MYKTVMNVVYQLLKFWAVLLKLVDNPYISPKQYITGKNYHINTFTLQITVVKVKQSSYNSHNKSFAEFARRGRYEIGR